jgi:hypothetical protein
MKREDTHLYNKVIGGHGFIVVSTVKLQSVAQLNPPVKMRNHQLHQVISGKLAVPLKPQR